MPRNGALIVRDLIGRLDRLRVECAKCDRRGSYSVAKLDPDTSLPDRLAEVSADCPRRKAGKWSDACDARCPDLSKLF
jgi:hypothetical protein